MGALRTADTQNAPCRNDDESYNDSPRQRYNRRCEIERARCALCLISLYGRMSLLISVNIAPYINSPIYYMGISTLDTVLAVDSSAQIIAPARRFEILRGNEG